MTSTERQPELPLSREDRFALIRAARFKLPDSRVRSYAHVYRLLEILEVCTGPRGGVCRISQEVLADKMRVSRATLKRVLGLAKELRVLDVETRVGSGGQGVCEYQVDWARVGQWSRQPAEAILYGRVIGVHAGRQPAQSSAVNGSAKNELALAHHEPALAHHEPALAHDDPAYLSHSLHDSLKMIPPHEGRDEEEKLEKTGKHRKRRNCGGLHRPITPAAMKHVWGVAAWWELFVALGWQTRSDSARHRFFAFVRACVRNKEYDNPAGVLVRGCQTGCYAAIGDEDEDAASRQIREVRAALAEGVLDLADPDAVLDFVEQGPQWRVPRPAAPAPAEPAPTPAAPRPRMTFEEGMAEFRRRQQARRAAK